MFLSYVFMSGEFVVKGLWVRKGFSAAYLEAITLANLPHGLTNCHTTLLYVLSDFLFFQGNEIIYVFIHLFYIYMLLLCVS